MIEIFGADFQQGTTADYTAGGTWATLSVGGVLSFTLPDSTTNSITPPVPVNGTTRTPTPLPGSRTPGTATVTLEYKEGLFATIKAKQDVKSCFRGKVTATKAMAFNGYISGMSFPEYNADGFQQFTVTIQSTSDVMEVAAT